MMAVSCRQALAALIPGVGYGEQEPPALDFSCLSSGKYKQIEKRRAVYQQKPGKNPCIFLADVKEIPYFCTCKILLP